MTDMNDLKEELDKIQELQRQGQDLKDQYGMDTLTTEMRTSLHQVAVSALCAKYLEEGEIEAIIETWKEYLDRQSESSTAMLDKHPEMKEAYEQMCREQGDPLANMNEKRDKVAAAFLLVDQSMRKAFHGQTPDEPEKEEGE